MNKLQASLTQGMFYEINLEGLGEFKFLFSENKESKSVKDKFFMECFWNPPNYGLVDHIVGYYCESVEWEINRILDDKMDYFIDGARVACLCRIDSNHDDEGVYEGILDEFFGGNEDNMDDEESFCQYDGDISELDCSDRECEGCEFYRIDDFMIVDYSDRDYRYYGYSEFLRKVIHNFDIRSEYGLIGEIKLIDAEVSKRIFFENENGDSFTVRYFISEQNEEMWEAGYTLYKDVRNEDGSGHGEEIDSGFAGARYVVSEDDEE